MIKALVLVAMLSVCVTELDDDGHPTSWTMVADPGPAPEPIPEKLPYTQLSGIAPRKLWYPAGPTPFLMSHQKLNRNDSFDGLMIGSITTGKRMGVISNLEASGRPWQMVYRPALSGDGRLLAVHDATAQVIRLIEVRTGKERRKLRCSTNVGLLFAKPDRLVSVCFSGPASVKVWNVATGKETLTIPVPEEVEDRAGQWTISPGGRFLAVAATTDSGAGHVRLFDLDTGKPAGVLWPNGRRQNSCRVQALAFSPDGKELAGVVSVPDRVNVSARPAQLIVWEAASGAETTRVVIDRGNRGMLQVFCSEPLQWFPDGKAFLIDQQMVTRREDGALVEFLKYEGSPDAYLAAKVLDDTRLLISTEGDKLTVRKVKR